MRLARHFIVHGRVQGVGFRYFVYDAALREGLHGVAGNRPDGTVEVIAEGEAEAMERFERKLWQGPRASHVDRVDMTEMEIGAYQTGFSIR